MRNRRAEGGVRRQRGDLGRRGHPDGSHGAGWRVSQVPVRVKNTGDVALTDLTLSDSDFSLAGCPAKPASLAPNDTYTCEITQALTSPGQHTNTATAGGKFGSTPVSDTDDANVLVRATGTLTITKSVVNTENLSPLPTFTVDVVCKVGDTVVKTANNVVISTSTPGTVANVPTGAECTVVEDAPSTTGWTWTTSYVPTDGKKVVTEQGPNTSQSPTPSPVCADPSRFSRSTP